MTAAQPAVTASTGCKIVVVETALSGNSHTTLLIRTNQAPNIISEEPVLMGMNGALIRFVRGSYFIVPEPVLSYL
jgi:hypothetical protein